MPERFDVFLCHHSLDRPTVKKIARQLRDQGLRPWLDEEQLPPGRSWQEELEGQIEQIGAVAVFVGEKGIGPWQNREIRAFLHQFVERQCSVIPVLLPNCPEPVPQLPVFMRDLTWVDFRRKDPDPLKHLVWGITDENLDRPSPRYLNPETQDLAQALKAAYRRRAELEARGEDVTEITETVLDLRRKIREGGQLKAGDFLLDGRLELLEPIGKGGFAQVWRAYDEKSHVEVAVKVLHVQYAEDRTRRERFFRGARHMARLQHPGIVRVFEESCEDGGYHFFVMEYLGGGDFREAVKAGRLSQEERLWIVLEVGEALAFAHERGVIHRDVKPGNVLLDMEDRPKLTDFDLVRAADTTGGTRTEGFGTFFYAAPESMMDAKTAGEPADVYGLGMTAVFALYGTDLPPQIVRNPVDFVGALEVDDRCRQVLQRAVAWEVEERWASVAELCQALRAVVAEDKLPAGYRSQGSRIESGTKLGRYTIVRSLSEPLGTRVFGPIVQKRFMKRAWAGDERPPWAVDSGRDAHGPWADFEVEGVVQRLRWIPEGSFQMGSPETEDGRDDDEGPRHLVTLTEGFWLADTPCTQALWQAVMGENPSRFQSPRRPVEQVSWDDCQEFLGRLNERVPDLEARLPTEAQWEYACRASTETGTWVGDLEILGANNAPVLDEIAWYGGNSGVDFDLKEGQDSRSWQEKQYAHRWAGTREVALKSPNPWGLYDILGNVYEWCSDWYGGHGASDTVDPAGSDEGESRVYRGGSWGSDARRVRAAYRDFDPPSSRWNARSFRMAAGQSWEIEGVEISSLDGSSTFQTS